MAEYDGTPSPMNTFFAASRVPEKVSFEHNEVEGIRGLEFPVTRHWAYLDHATRSPLPGSVAEASKRYYTERCEHGSFANLKMTHLGGKR